MRGGLLFSCAFVVSCANGGKDGAPGPQGPIGPQGPEGPAGSSTAAAIAVSPPLVLSAGSPARLVIPNANANSDGYLAASDWINFNNRVSNIVPGPGLTVTGPPNNPIVGVVRPAHAFVSSTTAFTPPASQSAAAGSPNEIPGLSVTITTHGGDLEIEGTLFINWAVAGTRGAFSASIDGQWIGTNLGWPSAWGNWYDGIIGQYAAQNWDTRVYHRMVPNVPAGVHTIKLLAWNETAGGWSLNCCNMMSHLIVKEWL